MHPILKLATPFKCKNNMYIPLEYNSAANRLKIDSVVYPLSVGITIKKQCDTPPTRIGFSAPDTIEGSIRPNDSSRGFRALERLRVKHTRTIGVKGFNRSNDLGFTASERLTNINKDLT